MKDVLIGVCIGASLVINLTIMIVSIVELYSGPKIKQKSELSKVTKAQLGIKE